MVIININAQEWLDKEYPRDGVCFGEFDKVYKYNEKNKGKKREEITKLVLNIDPWEDEIWRCSSCLRYNKGSYCNNDYTPCGGNEENRYGCWQRREEPEEQKWLVGSLKIEGFTNLEEIDCCEKQLTSLEIVHSPKLKVFSSYNSLNLILHNCLLLKNFVEQNTDLQTRITNYQSQISLLMNRLSELETTFDQQLKNKNKEWKNKIKETKVEITNFLHSGKGNSSHLHKEVKELQNKISDHEKLAQLLQKSRSIIDSIVAKEPVDAKNNLDNFYHELQKYGNNQPWKGTRQVLVEIRDKQEKIKQDCEELENGIKEKEVEIKKQFSISQKLTQKLLDNQQFQTNVEVLPKGNN